MAIDPNAVDQLAQKAVEDGGVLTPIEGNDVIDRDPFLQKLEPAPYVGITSDLQPQEEGLEYQVAGLQNFVAGKLGRVLSPKANTFNKIEQRLDELRQNQEKITEQPTDESNVNEEGFGPGLENLRNRNTDSFLRQTEIKADDETVAKFYENRDVAVPPNSKGLLDDFRAVGAGGDEKIPDEGTILNSIQSISGTYKNQITEATRGEITLTAQRQLADLVGMDDAKLAQSILERQRGGVFTVEGAGLAETMLASRDLLLREIKKLDELAEKAEFGTNEDALSFRAQLELVAQLQGQIKGAQTEIARALGSFRVPARTGRGEGLYNRDLTSLLDDYGGVESIKNIAKKYNQISDDPTQKTALARASKFRKGFDAFYEAWINILLSSPITHAKNTIGAFLTTFAHIPETYMAATMGSVRRKFGGTGGVYFGEANAQLFATVMALQDAFKAAGKAFVTGERVMPGTKIEGARGRRHQRAFSAEGMQAQGVLGMVADIAGHAFTLGRLPTRALEFEDTFFKVLAHRQSLYEQGYRSAMTKGKRGDDAAAHIAEYIFDPPKSALEKADAHAQYVTLQSNLDEIGKNIGGLRNIPTIRYFLPFFKTPYNAFKYALIDRGPIGIFYGEGRRAIERARAPGASPADKAAGDMAMGRLLLGNGTAVAVFAAAAAGKITGSGPRDPGLRDAQRQTGWQPYSIKIGDQYYSYSGFEPFSSILGVAADAAEAFMSSSLKQKTSEKIAAAVAAALGSQLTDKTFLQGFNTLMKAINDPERYGGTTLERFFSSLVPRLSSLLEKQLDPTVRAARDAVDQAKSQIPGWSSSLPPKRNLAGQTMIVSGSFGPDILSPIYRSTHGPNPADKNPARAKLAFEMFQDFVDVKFNPSKHPEEFNADIPLTPQEIDLFHQFAGKRTLEAFAEVRKDKNYKALKKVIMETNNQTAKEEMYLNLRRMLQEARNAARADLYTHKGPEGQKIRDAYETFKELKKAEYEEMQQLLRRYRK